MSTQVHAESRLERYLDTVEATGSSPVTPTRHSRRDSHVNHLAAFRWHWEASGFSPRTWAMYEHYLGHWQDWLHAATGSHDPVPSSGDVVAFLLAQSSPNAMAMARRALRAFYRWALSERLVDVDPTVGLRAPRIAESVVSVTSEDDFRALLATCEIVSHDTNSVRDRALLWTLWSTGMRRSEVVAMRLSDVTCAGDARQSTVDSALPLARGTIVDDGLPPDVVVVRQSKNGQPRSVVLCGDARQAIGAYVVERGECSNLNKALWLADDGRPLTGNGVCQMLRRRCARAGIKITAHSFRRAYAERWLAKGGSEVGLMRTAGWSSPSMVARYTRTNGERLAVEEARRLLA